MSHTNGSDAGFAIRLTAVMLAVLLAAGCTGGGAKPPPADAPPAAEPPDGQAPTPKSPDPAAPPHPSPDKPVSSGELTVRAMPGALKRRDYKPGEPIDAVGQYFMDVATGKVEGWHLGAPDPDRRFYVGTSPDHAWVMASDQQWTYALNRSSGATAAWENQAARHIIAGADYLVLERLGTQGAATGDYHVLDGMLKTVSRFHVAPAGNERAQAVLSPDGKRMALNRHQWGPGTGTATAEVKVVDLTSGQVAAFTSDSAGSGGTWVGTELALAPGSGDLMLTHILQVQTTASLAEQTLVRRFSWEGKLLDETSLRGRGHVFSPDGRWLAWSQSISGFFSTVTVEEAGSGKPVYRIVGAQSPNWLADSKRLLVHSDHGYRLASAGELADGPKEDFPRHAFTMESMRPAPHDPDLFALGATVLNSAGRVRQTVPFVENEEQLWMIHGASWSRSGQEIAFSVALPGGKDWNNGPVFPLSPAVQTPPFDDTYLLQVRDPAGECLNLRAEASTQSRVIQCLPNGTKLAAGDLGLAPIKLNQPMWYSEDRYWLWVQTEQNEHGWVAVNTGSLAWTGH